MISVFQMFSLVEWVIFSFIGANLALAATTFFHRGGKRFSGPGEK